MKYLVIKDCPGFKVGRIVEAVNTTLGRKAYLDQLNFDGDGYLVGLFPEYFKPMWFNFGDKIRRKDWDDDRYFIPTRCKVDISGSGVINPLFLGKNECNHDHWYGELNQDTWEFYKPKFNNSDLLEFKSFVELIEEYMTAEKNLNRKFRKRPVCIEAVQWTGKNLEEILQFCGSENIGPIERRLDYKLRIKTLESGQGYHEADHLDWIIKGVKGEFYPCKPDIFQETYEEIEE